MTRQNKLMPIQDWEGTSRSTISPYRIENLFFLNGIIAFMGWNVILSSLDYFSFLYKGYNVYLFLPIPCFIGYMLVAAIFNHVSSIYRYKHLMIVGIVGTNISLAVILLVSLFTRDHIQLGFWLLIVLSFVMGAFSNFNQLSSYAMLNYFNIQVVSRFNAGTAVGSLMINTMRMLIVAIFGNDESSILPIVLYFFLCLFFSFYSLSVNLELFKSDYFEEKIERHNKDMLERQKNSSVSRFQTTKQTLYSTFPLPVLIFFNFVITFMGFPNLSVLIQTSLPKIWMSLLVVQFYNIGDLAGKVMGEFRNLYNFWTNTYVFFSRFFLLFIIVILNFTFTSEDHLLRNDFFPFIIIFLFGFSNGFFISPSFVLCFEMAPLRLKKHSGVYNGVISEIGILVGNLLAIPLSGWVEAAS